MMRSVTVLSLLVLVVLSAIPLALATGKGTELHHLQGDVVSVDATANSLTVQETLKDGKTKEITFTTDAKTKVTIQGKVGQLSDLKAGDRLSPIGRGDLSDNYSTTSAGLPAAFPGSSHHRGVVFVG
jgi:hypothetical protein